MILHRENRVLAMPHAFHGVVIEVEMRYHERRGAGDAAGVARDCETVVLRRDKYLSCLKIAYGMVAAPVTVWQLGRPAAEGEAEQLVAETNPENRQRAVAQLANGLDGVADGGRVARSVREKHPIRLELANARRRGPRRDDGHATIVLNEQAQDVALHAVDVRHDVVLRRLRPFAVLRLDGRGARQVETIHRR